LEFHNPKTLSGRLALALVFAGLAFVPAEAQKSKRKPAPRPEPRTIVKTVVETVYVREKAPAVSFERRNLRPYEKAYGVHAALYSAEVLGSSPYGFITYDIYPLPKHAFFVQIAGGIGFAQSNFSADVIGADRFDPNMLIGLEVLAGFNLGAPKATAGTPGGLYPYLLAGIAGLYQGTEPNVAAVLGFGQRVPFPWGKSMDRWALSYGVRDQIYSQKIEAIPSLTQNPVVHLGVLRYY
jgi:hypothetical protein